MNITHKAKEKYRKDGLAALLKSGIRFTVSYVRRYPHNKKNSLYYKSHKLVQNRFPLSLLGKILFGVLF